MVGKIPGHILDALLDTLPVDFTLIDEHDRIIAWNKNGSRLFPRSRDMLGTDVRDCHTVKSMAMLERMLDEMKRGERDEALFWYTDTVGEDARQRMLLVAYYAVRDGKGTYLGCVSAVREIDSVRGLRGENRDLR
jgi:PAS domain S-box-containing protein